MAEGGIDFHNPEYDRDDYDNTDELPLIPNKPVDDILNTSEHLQDLRGQLRNTALEQQKTYLCIL